MKKQVLDKMVVSEFHAILELDQIEPNKQEVVKMGVFNSLTLVKDWKFGPWQVFGLWGRKVYFEVLITV